MIHKSIPLVLLLFFSSEGQSQATAEQFQIVTDSILQICRGGHLKGSSSLLEIRGEGSAKAIVLKKLVEAGLEGEFKFTQAEWAGIEPLLTSSEDYSKCVTTLTPIFLQKL